MLGLKLCGTYNVPVHSKDSISNDRKTFRKEAENRLFFFIFEVMWNKKERKLLIFFNSFSLKCYKWDFVK